jgi:hypothetical protein
VRYGLLKYFRRAVTSVFRKSRTSKSIPYLVSVSMPITFTFPKDFKIDEFDGLELCYVLSTPSKSKELVVMWEDETHYRVHHDSLERCLSLSRPASTGFLADVVQPKESLWTRYSWKEWLLGAAALLGAISVLHAHFADVFDAPDVKLAFADTAALDVDEDGAFNVQMSVLNGDAYTATNVNAVKASAKCPDGTTIPVIPNVSTLPPILPAQSASIRLDGASPHHGSYGLPGDCTLLVSVSARTGYLRRNDSFSASKTLRIWPIGIGWSSLSSEPVERSAPMQFLQAKLILYPGKPYDQGAKGSFSVKSTVDEDIVISMGRLVEKINPLSSLPSRDNLVIHTLEFQTRPLEKFRAYPLLIGLRSRTAISMDRWRQLLQQSEFHVQ